MADIPVYLLSKLAARHVKVVLSGEGSDELLAGYPKHWGDLAVAQYQRVAPAALDAPVLGGAAALAGYGGRRLQVMLRAAQQRDFVDRQAAWFGLMSRAEARRLCPGLPGLDRAFVWAEDPGDSDPLQRALMFDKTVWLPGTLLERGDRLTMAASIEGRMPFMDTALAAFVARLPPPAFLAGRTGKQVLRRAMAATPARGSAAAAEVRLPRPGARMAARTAARLPARHAAGALGRARALLRPGGARRTGRRARERPAQPREGALVAAGARDLPARTAPRRPPQRRLSRREGTRAQRAN